MCIPGQRAALVQATFWGLQLLPSCGSAIFNEPPRPVCLSAWKVAHERFFQAQICLGVVLPLYSLSMGLYFTTRVTTKRGGTVITGRRRSR